MKKILGIGIGIGSLYLLGTIMAAQSVNTTSTFVYQDHIFTLFQNPPREARPFVRWWWNGDCVEEDELARELDVLKGAGIGGFEINPIKKPDGGDAFDFECYDWLSPEWNRRVKKTIEFADQRNMVVDLIVGSGWPFGGKFLHANETLQGLGLNKIKLKGPFIFTGNIKDIMHPPGPKLDDKRFYKDAPPPELFFLKLVPETASGTNNFIDVKNKVDEQGNFIIDIPSGAYELFVGTYQRGFREVYLGAPGSDGPVLDHYNAEAVRKYLDKLSQALEAALGGKLGRYIRSIFCDSIELGGANWTTDFSEEFQRRRGYNVTPFLPLIIDWPSYKDTLNYSKNFNDDILRVRYDFNKTLVEIYLERFVTNFNHWAHEHNLKSRYQSYGAPWLMGLLEGNLLVDIPEGNNWLYSPNPKTHGFWIWNKYASSGAHLTGAKTVSCEAMTNTQGVFKTTLETIKKADDFNFITGINHSVLHGFNYSPPQAGFPGWVRYGTYFNEHNTWWPYFKHWTDYNARLSAVFQKADPVVEVAILAPEADIWSEKGLIRTPFQLAPAHDLWEAFSRLGMSADYVNEKIIQGAIAQKGNLEYGPVSYKLLLIAGVQSIEPATAKAIQNLAEQGVRVVFAGRYPDRSPSYLEKEQNDHLVKQHIQQAITYKQVSLKKWPVKSGQFTSWAEELIQEAAILPEIKISPWNEKLYQVHYRAEGKKLYFFSNQSEKNIEFHLNTTFEDKRLKPWVWEPETGERHLYPTTTDGHLEIHLGPLESLLLVFDPEASTVKHVSGAPQPDTTASKEIFGRWRLDFHPVTADEFHIDTNLLFDISQSPQKRLNSFAGTIFYTTTFDAGNTHWDFLDLGKVKDITEVRLNGKLLGTKWWGEHIYPIKDELKNGKNELEIKYTTTLSNYIHSLKNNSVAKEWDSLKEPEHMGLTKPLRFYRKKRW